MICIFFNLSNLVPVTPVHVTLVLFMAACLPAELIYMIRKIELIMTGTFLQMIRMSQ